MHRGKKEKKGKHKKQTGLSSSPGGGERKHNKKIIKNNKK